MLFKTCSRVLGILLLLFSLTFLPPIVISYIYHDGEISVFVLSTFLTLLTGLILWLPFRKHTRNLRTHDGFIIVVLLWVMACLFAALPLYLVKTIDIGLVDAIFESVSGITTTGSTALVNIDLLPKSILFYRQQLQFLGGIGIIVLAVAVLPFLGIGGLQLLRAELTGPIKDNKLTPRIAQTAKGLLYIYVALTAACILAYSLAGMPLFDAVCYAFSTVSTGGYTPSPDNFGYYDFARFKLIATFFMLLGSFSFALHFIAIRKWTLSHYLQNEELRSFIRRLLFLTLGVFVILWVGGDRHNLISILFQVTSLITTTGFTTDELAHWPSVAAMLVFFGALIGGCTGSSCGGIKSLRFLILCKQSFREIKRVVHPQAVLPLKLFNKPVSMQVLDATWGFIGIYLLSFVILILALMALGLDFYVAFSSAIASLANVGPGLGNVFDTFAYVSDGTKILLSFAMLLGRLEIFTVLVLFLAIFWRK